MTKVMKLLLGFMMLLGSFQYTLAKPDQYEVKYSGILTVSLSDEILEFHIPDVVVPGDTYSEEFTFTNEHTHDIELLMSSKTFQEYADTFEFDIYKDDQMIIQKTLENDIDTDFISLGNIENGQTVHFIIRLYVPTKLDNSYNFSKGNVEWKLVVEDNCPAIPVPNTGIYDQPAYLILAGSSIVAAILLGMSKKNGGSDDEEIME